MSDNPKIVFLDTYYPRVLQTAQELKTYESRLNILLRMRFGTSDYYSEAFKKYGWDAVDLIANDNVGRLLWCSENDVQYADNKQSVLGQIERLKPDVVYCQDLSFCTHELKALKQRGVIKVLTGQHSCPWAGDEVVRQFDMLYTSFPHYIDRISSLGVKAEFLPIAFGGLKLFSELLMPPKMRDYDCTFVGGLGGGKTSGHWDGGTKTLGILAKRLPSFKWWGYGLDQVPSEYPELRKAYQGEAWGRTMYGIYARSKIVVNRHGEVANGYSNNMRLFEATGMGAMLFTEDSKNIKRYFDPRVECEVYSSPEGLANKIEHYLMRVPQLMMEIAVRGQQRTLIEHTYVRRLAKPSEQLVRMLK